jgi:hypothetical protein
LSENIYSATTQLNWTITSLFFSNIIATVWALTSIIMCGKLVKKLFPSKEGEPEDVPLVDSDTGEMKGAVRMLGKSTSDLAQVTIYIYGCAHLGGAIICFATTLVMYHHFDIWNYWFTLDIVMNSIALLSGFINCCACCCCCIGALKEIKVPE